MFYLLKNAFLQLILHTALTASGWAAIDCSALFLNKGTKLDSITTDWTKGSTAQSVIPSGAPIRGTHGGKRLLLERVAERWISSYATFRFDVQGDPRWFIGAAGVDVARYFGFEILSNRQMTVPDVTEFQGAVTKINSHLKSKGKEPIALQFKADDLGGRNLSGYLDNFLDGKLTFAKEGNHLVHDMSFHTGAIYMPVAYVKAVQTRVRFVRDFLDYVFEDPALFGSELHAITKKYLNIFLVRGIDNGTAFLNLLLIAEKTDNPIVQKEIDSLLAVMNDNHLKGASLAIGSSFHFVFGMIDQIKHYNDDRLVFKLSKRDSESYELADYAFEVMHEIFKFYDLANAAMPIATRLSSSKNSTRHPIYHQFLTEKMLGFLNTNKGSQGSMDIGQVLSPHFRYSGDSLFKANQEAKVINDVRSAYQQRITDIHNAVRELNSN